MSTPSLVIGPRPVQVNGWPVGSLVEATPWMHFARTRGPLPNARTARAVEVLAEVRAACADEWTRAGRKALACAFDDEAPDTAVSGAEAEDR